jgi:hypothetical protein
VPAVRQSSLNILTISRTDTDTGSPKHYPMGFA